jgi:DNA repair protein RAD50
MFFKTKLQRESAQAESRVESAEMLEGELETHKADMEEKMARIEKAKSDIANAKYDERVGELVSKTRELEGKRDILTQEIRTLSLQADQRAKLALHQNSVTTKTREIKTL